MTSIKQSVFITARVKELFPHAVAAMKKEYHKPDRVKLTHYWIAEQLEIPKYLAFVLLARVAQKRVFCVRMPNGPIYWDNELISVGRVMDAIASIRIRK